MSRRKTRSVARILSKGLGASQEEELVVSDNKAAETKGASGEVDNKLEVLAIFLRNLKKCSVVRAVARVVVGKGIRKCKDQGELISR